MPAVVIPATPGDGRSRTFFILKTSKRRAAITAAVITSAMLRPGRLSAASTPATLPSVAGIAILRPARHSTSAFAWNVRKRHQRTEQHR